MNHNPSSFGALLQYFPNIELPITLNTEIHHVFSKENKPLPSNLIRGFLTDEEGDDYTEFVACFRLPVIHDFQPIIFWKASLMEYQYVLSVFTRKGVPVSSKIIAGTKSNGKTMLNRIATLDQDGVITIAEGVGSLDERRYNAQGSQTFQLEISPTGDILQMIND